MKHTFVIDENVVIGATTQQDPITQLPDLTCANLVNRILLNCHSIAWSISTNARWSQKVQALRYEGRAIDPTFMSVLSLYQVNVDKCPVPPAGDPPPLADEHTWTTTKLPDDAPFIRLAVFFGCFLVTTDYPLRDDVARRGYGCRVLLPAEALAYAEQPSI